jgi:hypothetical protein
VIVIKFIFSLAGAHHRLIKSVILCICEKSNQENTDPSVNLKILNRDLNRHYSASDDVLLPRHSNEENHQI